MGLRTLLLLLAAGIGLWVFNNWRQRRSLQDKRQTPAPPAHMVRCAHCGLHVPEDEAVKADGRDYCSEEHARQGPANDERP